MNFEFLKQMGAQIAQMWSEIKTHQKFTIIAVLTILVGLLVFLGFNASQHHYVPLFPSNRLMLSDAAEVKSYLDGLRINYKLKGDTLIMVPEQEVHKVRMDLAAVGLPKMHSGKGFELFDTNTWIKGEKELQVMEMRALKGQLERDIAEYENIKGASVTLDLAPPRPFGGALYKTKASVILTLMPGARLSQSQLRAITYHISGAVRGLLPNMVAISDTTGKLYQSIDPDGDFDNLRSAEVSVEEHLKSKVDGMLAMIVGHDNYYSTVQVVMSRSRMSQERRVHMGKIDGVNLGDPVVLSVTEAGMQMSERERGESGTPGSNTEAVAGAIAGGEELLNREENRDQTYRQMAVPIDHVKIASLPGKVESISLGVLIDKTITIDAAADLPEEEMANGKRDAQELRDEIENQLAKILEGYGVAAKPAVDFVEFDKTKFNKTIAQESWSATQEMLVNAATAFFVFLTVIGMFWTFNRFWRRHMLQPPSLENEERDEEDIFEMTQEPSLVEVEAMVESIRMRFQNDPTVVVDTIKDWLAENMMTAGKE